MINDNNNNNNNGRRNNYHSTIHKGTNEPLVAVHFLSNICLFFKKWLGKLTQLHEFRKRNGIAPLSIKQLFAWKFYII